MENKAKALKAIAEEIIESKRCPLARLALGKPVPGEGPPNAKIFFVGQAPGKEESKTGKPFVGRAGKFLNQTLERIGLSRKKIFITSPEKYFPPKNRLPTLKELAACKPWLLKQIEIVDPKIIVLLGNFAAKALKNEKILENRIVLKTYHPAAAMRFPKIKKKFIKDFFKLKEILKKLN